MSDACSASALCSDPTIAVVVSGETGSAACIAQVISNSLFQKLQQCENRTKDMFALTQVALILEFSLNLQMPVHCLECDSSSATAYSSNCMKVWRTGNSKHLRGGCGGALQVGGGLRPRS